MTRSLKFKWLFIVAVILFCLYGIIGIPRSRADIANNFRKNINLGLDLRGGSQLVMQVQVQDAFKAEADATIERLKDALRKAGIEYGGMDRNDPATVDTADTIQVNVHGVPSVKAGDFRRVVNEQFGAAWNLTPVNATDYRLNLKPTEALKLRTDTVAQTMNTIEKKINGLGLAESSVQQRGRAETESQILVQLPGVDDPARIKEILRTAAMLELYKVVGRTVSVPGRCALARTVACCR